MVLLDMLLDVVRRDGVRLDASRVRGAQSPN